MGETDKMYLKRLINGLIEKDKEYKDYYNMVYNVLVDYTNKLNKDEIIDYISTYKDKYTNNNQQFFATYINNKVNYKDTMNIFTKNLKYYMELRR